MIDEGPDILIILAIAAIASFLFRRLLRGVKDWSIERMNRHGDANSLDNEKNIKTIEAVLGRSLTFVIWAGAALAILQKLKIDTSALITSAGIVGVAVGFGSQTLIKDVIAGLFMLIENQIRVNDGALINGIAGVVEEVNLRTTVVRAENGALHIFPNGSITALANLSRGFAQYLFEFVVEHGANVDKAFTIMSGVIDQMREEEAYKGQFLAPLEIYGVDRIIEQGVVLRARIKTQPHKQWGIGREANKRIRAQFAQNGIPLAAREWNVNFSGGGTGIPASAPGLAAAAPPAVSQMNRDELKSLIREILREDPKA